VVGNGPGGGGTTGCEDMFASKIRMFTAVAAFATLVATPSLAHADGYAYPCGVTYQPSSAWGYGDHGSVTVSYYSAPACSGSYLATRRYCSENATSSSCPYWVYQYGEVSLASLYDNLVRAAEVGMRVYEYLYYCQSGGGGIGGSYSCGRTVSFYGD